MNVALYVLDVAHPPRPGREVEAELLEAVRVVRNTETLRAIKVVHGYGSTGRGGATRTTVRNWAFNRRRQLRAVIEGEKYDLFGEMTQGMIRELGPLDDPDCGTENPGITILWVR